MQQSMYAKYWHQIHTALCLLVRKNIQKVQSGGGRVWPICESVKGLRVRGANQSWFAQGGPYAYFCSHSLPSNCFTVSTTSYPTHSFRACASHTSFRHALHTDSSVMQLMQAYKLQTRNFNAMYRDLRDQSEEETAVVGLFACDKLPCESCSHSIPSSFHPSLSLSFSPLPGELIDDI